MNIITRTGSRSTSELYDKCTFAEWQNISFIPRYHELIKTALELYIKKELDDQRENLWQYAFRKSVLLPPDESQFEEFATIFIQNNISPLDFAVALKMVLEKTDYKINALRLIGIPNSCKTLLSNCIVNPFICCRMNNHGSENEFFMSNMLNKAIIQCEELYITVATAEDFKSVLGGQPLDIAKKFNEKQMLCRTPVIITSNYERFGRGHVPPTDENALAIRCHNFRFFSKYKPSVKLEWQQFYLFLIRTLESGGLL